MRENICKLYDQLRVNIQHIETVHTTQNNNKKKNQFKNGQKTRTDIFSKGEVQIANRHMKRSQHL